MKLNVIAVLNEVAIENESENILREIYAEIANDPTGFRGFYNMYCQHIEACNAQTWEMVHFYENRYGLDYVNNELNWNIEEIPTFEEFVAARIANVNFIG